MAKKKKNNLLLRTGVNTLILIMLVLAAGCAGSTTAESPGESESPVTTEVTEVPQETETAEESETQHEVSEQDEGTEIQPEGVEQYDNTEEAEHAEPDEDSASPEDEESTTSSEQIFTAEELGLIVLEEGIKPPDFTLPTLEGPEITLSDFQGSYVVLNFWSTKCPPCVAEMGYFEVVGKQHPDELAILTVDIRESDSKVSDFFGDGERSFIAALDKAGEVASTYGIRYTPTTFFIDTEGNVPYAKVGAFSSQQHFEESVALLMAK